MTEEEARAWLKSVGVSSKDGRRLQAYVDLLLARSGEQNLISAASRDAIWSRHIVDSAQLVPLAGSRRPGRWLDLGSGAGLPGMVTALLTGTPTTLLEPRALRVTFLREVAAMLGLEGSVEVVRARAEMFPVEHFLVISARAFAPLNRVFVVSHRFSSRETLWLLPKGANASRELASVERDWRGVFHVEQSVTDTRSGIIVAREVEKR